MPPVSSFNLPYNPIVCSTEKSYSLGKNKDFADELEIEPSTHTACVFCDLSVIAYNSTSNFQLPTALVADVTLCNAPAGKSLS